jgi:hypothetical protein
MTHVGAHHPHHERASWAVLTRSRGIRGPCLTPHPPIEPGQGGRPALEPPPQFLG